VDRIWPRALEPFAERIENIGVHAQQMANNAPFVVYVFLDVMRADPYGHYRGLPIYVGETAKLLNRIIDHFKLAAANNEQKRPFHRELARLLEADTLPSVDILHVCQTRDESRVAETLLAQDLLKAGYTLFNRQRWQSEIMLPRHRAHWERRSKLKGT
jgi:hypothetical protein